tara:strand:+ start:91 stop:504 length:414 start_codon:yes stop_codon:yes gene_type:complete
MNKDNNLDILPVNFRHEKNFLLESNFNTWSKLRFLKDRDISNILKKNRLCTESRLKKIRAISVFIYELEIKPHHAYLLLHCGIGTIKAISILEAHDVFSRIGRLERKLNIKTIDTPNIVLIKSWIKKSKNIIENNFL